MHPYHRRIPLFIASGLGCARDDVYSALHHHPQNKTCSMAQQFTAAESRVPRSVHVLLITTGSVASIKAPLIVGKLLEVHYPHCYTAEPKES